MTVTTELLAAAALGYLLGAVPTGVLLCKALRGVDVRQSGSGHTGGMNVSRVAGVCAGVLTAVIDAALGAAAVAGSALLVDSPWAVSAAGVMAVVGHNWSVFIRLGGGIGLSTLAGALLYRSPAIGLGALAALLLLWVALDQLLHISRARATVLTMAAVGPLLWALGFPIQDVLLGALGGAVVIIKTLPDWNRQYGPQPG